MTLSCDADHSPGLAPAGREVPASLPSEVLDMEALRRRCMGNLAFVQRVLTMFQRQLPEDLAELDKVLGLQDAEQVARVAHRIKGTSANVSAKGLQQAAADIEALSRVGRVEELGMCVEQLRGEWDKYVDYTSALLAAAETA